MDSTIMVKAFDELLAFVRMNEQLQHLLPAAAEMSRIAHQLDSGGHEHWVPEPSLRIDHIPTRQLAEAVMRRIAAIPGVSGDESDDFKRAYAYLSAGLVYTIMHVIFRDYPDLVPSEPSGRINT